MVARYNPCGAFVDIGRSPYTVRARLYPDSDLEFDLVWYECRPDAPPLPYPSAINSLYQEGDREPWLPTVVGEVFGTAHTYHETHKKQFALGTHQCGTAADFAGEGSIDLAPPFVEYRRDELPKCCGNVLFEPTEGGVEFFQWDTGGFQLGGSCPAEVYDLTSARGGFQVGGAPGIVAYLPYPSIGGVQAGGSAAIVAHLPYPSAGGYQLGGACGAVVVIDGLADGGTELGGACGLVVFFALTTDGGEQLGGAAGMVWSLSVAAAGGGALGGAAGLVIRLAVPAAGGGALGGAAGLVARLPIPAAGGGALGGAAGVVVRPTGGASGGQQIGGACGEVYTPPTPTPGTQCSNAATVNQGVTYNYNGPSGATQQWFTFTLPSSGTWHLASTGVGGMSGVTFNLYSGGSCPFPGPLSATTFGPPRWVWTGSSGDVIWLQVFPALSGTPAYTFNWDSGS